jgi:Mg/Co/Ni transporter MgtE
MSPDFIALAPTEEVARALGKVRESELGAGTLTSVYLLDDDGLLRGSVFVVTLLRSDPHTPLEQIAEREPVWVSTDAEVPEVARMMTDYNLVMLPVLDADERMVGVVTVDDVLELTLPSGWRRRFGVVRD